MLCGWKGGNRKFSYDRIGIRLSSEGMFYSRCRRLPCFSNRSIRSEVQIEVANSDLHTFMLFLRSLNEVD